MRGLQPRLALLPGVVPEKLPESSGAMSTSGFCRFGAPSKLCSGRFRCSIQRFRKEPVCGIEKSAETIMLLGIALEFICKLGRRKMEERKTTRGLVFFWMSWWAFDPQQHSTHGVWVATPVVPVGPQCALFGVLGTLGWAVEWLGVFRNRYDRWSFSIFFPS